MATFTTRLSLRKPATSDAVNVTTDISDSMDTIDTAATFESLGSNPGSPFTGKTIQRSDLNERPFFYNGTKFISLLDDAHRIVKPSDTTVNNMNTDTDDPHLVFTDLSINRTYEIEIYCIYTSVSATPDIRFSFSGPSGAGFTWTTIGLVPTVSSSDGDIRLAAGSISSTKTIGTVAGTDCVCIIKGVLLMGSSTGSFKFRWCQNTATAENTTVRGFSWMTAKRLQ